MPNLDDTSFLAGDFFPDSKDTSITGNDQHIGSFIGDGNGVSNCYTFCRIPFHILKY